ncbi:MAG TPA: molybdenum cofactor biosynthesis protein MoaE [Saprospiraceae bacterium]|nr:molybdenum cofactor biosynthesis protein MoaE [Saprospiraceae bacterium]
MMDKETATGVKSIFIQGPIPVQKVSDMLEHHAHRHEIGAHDLFIGQVRADHLDGHVVSYIEYTAYVPMADKVYQMLYQDIMAKYQLTCLHTIHSLGKVECGQWSLVVFASAPHRQACFDACREMVERIKKELPVWGKEFLEDKSSVWKENT